MNTFLDLLVVVVMVLTAVGLTGLALMFLVKNRKVQRVSLWLVSVLGVLFGWWGLRIMWPFFTGQALIAAVMGLAALAAPVLAHLSRDNEKKFRIARILAAVALVVGMLNTLN